MPNAPDNNPAAWEATLVDPRLKNSAAPMTPEKERQWRAGSRQGSTFEAPRTGVASLDSVQVDATKDPLDFSDAERMEALVQREATELTTRGVEPAVARVTAQETVGTPEYAYRLHESLRPQRELLKRAAERWQEIASDGAPESDVTQIALKKLEGVKAAQAGLEELETAARGRGLSQLKPQLRALDDVLAELNAVGE